MRMADASSPGPWSVHSTFRIELKAVAFLLVISTTPLYYTHVKFNQAKNESGVRQRRPWAVARRRPSLPSVQLRESGEAARTSGPAALLAAAYFQVDLILPALSAYLLRRPGQASRAHVSQRLFRPQGASTLR